MSILDSVRKELLQREYARRNFAGFMQYMHDDISMDRFHTAYYEILNKFAHGTVRKLIVTCPPQSGKLLDRDTPVLTANRGWVPHGDLLVGDYVFAPDGVPVKVLWNSGVYEWLCRDVHFADGYSLVASYNHEWGVMICNSNHKPVFHHRIETDEIMDKVYDRSPYIVTCNALDFSKFERSVPLEAYQLGLWLGDGNKTDNVITKSIEDLHFLFSTDHILEIKQEKGKPNCGHAHLSLISTSDLRKNGLLNNKHIPEQYLFASIPDRLSLLQGLFDTDGTVDDTGRCEFYNMNKNIADGVAFLLRSFGYKPCLRTKSAILNGVDHGKCYCVAVSPNKDFPLFRFPRKYDRLTSKKSKDRADKFEHFITSINDAGIRHGNCIQVEGGYYLAGEQLIPTHNSEGSTRNLPAYMHGLNPNLRICIASYGFPLAEGFNRAIKGNIASAKYANLFPDTVLSKTEQAKKLKGTYDPSIYVNNARTYRLIGKEGVLIAVGRGGALTGNPVDIGIVDDLYKDDTEGNSPLVRDAAWNWYVDVFSTRLHNNSQQLITFTRWHEDDIIGRLKLLCEKEQIPFYEITSLAQLDNCDPRAWYIINFEAIKESEATDIDQRAKGEALWPEKHNIDRLLEQRKLDPARFQSLYQGNPMPVEGLLYTKPFQCYRSLPEEHKGSYLYCDVADRGDDYLCSIPFIKTMTGKLYIHDILYTQEGTEITEQKVAEQIIRNKVKTAWIESNSGGAIFARNVKRILSLNKYVCYIYDINNSSNKESRILTNAVDVMDRCMFEDEWQFLYPEFYRDTMGFRKLFKANKHDDACFVAGTMIATLTGDKPIERIKVGDYVITPYGMRKVLSAGITGYKEVIDNIGLCGTPNHKIFTDDGFKHLDSLTGTMECSILSYRGLLIWKYQKLLYSMESHIDSWGRESTILVSHVQMKEDGMLKDCMWQFGNFIMEKKFLRAIKFIIKMVILLTTTSITWSVYRLGNMLKNIHTQLNASKNAKSILMPCVRKRQHGISLRRVLLGTRNMLETGWDILCMLLKLVLTVVKNLIHHSNLQVVPCFAQIDVENSIGLRHYQRPIQQSVSSVARSSLRQLGTRQRSQLHVAEAVQTNLSIDTEKRAVYNLTVDGVHVYYANGILVSNCDCLTGAVEQACLGKSAMFMYE